MTRLLLPIFILGALLSGPLSAKELQGTLKTIGESGTIKIGYRKDLPPMSFSDTNGIPNGYTIDLCNHIAGEVEDIIGRKIDSEFIAVTSENRFEALANGTIDILCGSATTTLARRELVDFTQLVFVTGGSYMVLKGRNIRNNFEGKKIGVGKGTTTARALRELLEEVNVTADIVPLDSLHQGVKALEKGKIDILSADQVVLIGLLLQADNPSSYTILPDMFSFDPIAIAVRRNDADFRLVADRALSELFHSGKIIAIYEQWFGQFSPTMPEAYRRLIELAIPKE